MGTKQLCSRQPSHINTVTGSQKFELFMVPVLGGCDLQIFWEGGEESKATRFLNSDAI
jgi:hypothetical protein